ncbi:DUF2804 domain-containing protein [Streptomyces xinghaiensis]|uniref:DUF2804 domain-containing protein n=1 Tax=Streptomyces xinghaiensis TaxID=1038928 RepID=UPI0037BD00ED
MPTHEREITRPADLCLPGGRRLDRAAVGWSRTPLHRCDLRGWGRTKRWEYWCVTTPTHLVAVTVADIDYLGLGSVYFLEYGRGNGRDGDGAGTGPGGGGRAGAGSLGTVRREISRTALLPLAHGVRLPHSLGGGTGGTGGTGGNGGDGERGEAAVAAGPVRIGMRRERDGTRLRFRCRTAEGPLDGDLFVAMPPGHETMSVVIPWNDRRFQYTSKHTARPAEGTVRIGGTAYDFQGGWGVLDHGRGRWPYDTRWNWGAASGSTDGRVVGLQFGGRWTAGTGMTENALCVDGRLTKIGEELEWHYDDFGEPWTIRTPGSDAVDLSFTPFHVREDRTNTGVILNDTHQSFGHYTGTVRADGGTRIRVEGLLGWAEQVRMRW